jgi:uncharacterized protein (TIGR02145 family)
MKKLLLFAALLVTALSFSQVGIGTTTPKASAQLDVTSTTKGFLPPRLTYVQKTAIASPVAGLLIWCSDCGTNGESQVYNGTTWTNISGTTASFAKPVAPTSPVATAGNAQASVAFTVPSSTGGSAITGYTVTSSGGQTVSGASSPLIVTSLTNGTSYTFTVVATNVAGNSVASAASTAVTLCGAYVASGVYKVFACYNLGTTDTTVDPNVPVQAISGNYYQWGKITPVATATTPSGSISGWSNTPATDGAWSDATKTGNDPCPDGFRVPTNTQWAGVIANNTITRTGTWAENFSNWNTAIHFGTETVKTLTLPAQGYRNNNGGTLGARALTGVYWASTTVGSGGNPYHLYFYLDNLGSSVLIATTRLLGFSVRCVSQ